jgi:hypothetical protein
MFSSGVSGGPRPPGRNGGFEWVEPTGRRERDGGKAQPAAGRDLLLARTPDVRVREEDQMAALAVQAG